jgi:hypothetical protein
MIEYDNPKDEARLRKFMEASKDLVKLQEKFTKAGFTVPEILQWTDNTGRMFVWFEYSSLDRLAKFYGDEDLQQYMGKIAEFIDNVRIRLLRPAIPRES